MLFDYSCYIMYSKDGGKMSDTNNTDTRKSVKNIYDRITGFSLMINLYVIKYIYYHIEKARYFIDEDDPSKKKKSIPIYSHTYFPLSRQRLDRINKGSSFELTQRESDSIITAYGIDKKYFSKDDPEVFVIKGIDETAWKCFYNYNYKGKYALPSDLQSDKEKIKKIADKVKEILKELAENWETTLKRDDPVFAVCYYFHYGVRFDRPSAVANLKESLMEMPYVEWDKESMTSLNEMSKLLKGHCNYVTSLITLNKLRKEQQNQKKNTT